MSHNEKLKIVSEFEGEIEIISLNGYLDAHTAIYLEDFVQTVLHQKKYRILFDLADLDYISSAGLGVFMEFIEEIREADGDIKFCSMKENVFSVFDLLGFPMLFDIEKQRKSAIDKFNLQFNTENE